ncbi:hypothetical protein HPB49_015545 [Dermacentor silvarum]|uniref:Uncharacterized protein n=1 Tax=Dermacentor silvarum TaxID=543639 RepID=A0ACB8D6A7_DERSI|nr:hypothetical protein HPB49_015545 [Dermacentor silvarum]
MEKSGRQAYLESASNAEQEGPRVFAHNVATSLGERARKHQRQPTHEQGTDTELEALHKDLIGARQCYQGLPKPDTAEYGREVHRDTSGEDNVHKIDHCASDHYPRATKLRCPSKQQKVLETPKSQVFEGNLNLKFQTNESNSMPDVLSPECGFNSGVLATQVNREIDQIAMHEYNDEEERESQTDELLVVQHDKTVEVNVRRGISQVEATDKRIRTAKNDAGFEHVSNDTIGDALGLSKSRLSYKHEIENANAPVMTALPRMLRLKKIFVSPERPRRGVHVTDDDLMDSIASAATQISVLTAVNKDLQAHISTTEQKVNKYRDKNAVLANELRRIHAQKGRLEDQLAAARVNSKLQTSRMQFTGEEGKVLRKKIQEGEEAFTMKLRSTKDQIEGRLARSQGALEKAKGENQAALREIRHLQRRIDDTSKEADAERKRGREFEEEKDKMNEQIKKLEARLHDAKRECSLEKSRRLDVKRQVEDALERREKLKRELLAACSELSSSNSTTGRFTGLRNDPRNMMVYAPNSGAP